MDKYAGKKVVITGGTIGIISFRLAYKNEKKIKTTNLGYRHRRNDPYNEYMFFIMQYTSMNTLFLWRSFMNTLYSSLIIDLSDLLLYRLPPLDTSPSLPPPSLLLTMRNGVSAERKEDEITAH